MLEASSEPEESKELAELYLEDTFKSYVKEKYFVENP